MSFATRGRAVCAALLAAATIGAVVAPTAAQAGHGDAVAAGVLGAVGGLAVGSAIAHDQDRGYVVRERVVRDCWWERRRFENRYGDIIYRRVKVCE